MVLDLYELAMLKAELEARRSPGAVRLSDDVQRNELPELGHLVGEAASSSGYLGAEVVPGAGQFAAIHVAAVAVPVVVDALELFAKSLGAGSSSVCGLYRRTPLEAMQPASSLPTGGVPLSAQTFASALSAAPSPDGQVVFGPGWSRREQLGWLIPQGSGLSIVGPVGLTLAFGLDFHELVS